MSKNKKIIGFSARMLSGKGVLSNAMKEYYDADIVTVASALKNLVCEMLPSLFASIPELNRKKRDGDVLNRSITGNDIKFISDKTNVPYEFVEKKCNEKDIWYDVRDILQFIGTEIVRAYNPLWHVMKLKENILKSKSEYVCVDDVRFPNERAAVEELGGESFFVIRPQTEIMSNHSSETSIKWQEFNYDHIILNDSDEETLVRNFVDLYRDGFYNKNESPILLSGNDFYTKHNTCFGYYNENANKNAESSLLKKIIEQNKNREEFKKYGFINFYTEDFNERINFANTVLNSYKSVDYCRYRFTLYNPLIYENLKFYL